MSLDYLDYLDYVDYVDYSPPTDIVSKQLEIS
jgi:hypothetical protein